MVDARGNMHDAMLTLNFGPLSSSPGIKYYIDRGLEIPDRLLPGRALMRMSPEYREKLIKTDFSNVAPWWIKVICG